MREKAVKSTKITKTCKVFAPAKINLFLDVTGTRDDGYHNISTIMQSISLGDIIEVSVTADNSCNTYAKPVHNRFIDKASRISLKCDDTKVPQDMRNVASKAAAAFLNAVETSASGFAGTHSALQNVTKIKINIKKNIPQQAGLAGGSADAAGTLLALNEIFEHPFSSAILNEIGAGVGADVPFCLTGGTALCEGIGEKITQLDYYGDTPILLVKPPFGISTPWAYKQLDENRYTSLSDSSVIISKLRTHNIENAFTEGGNIFERVAASVYPEILSIKEQLMKTYGCKGAMMTGSGTAIYAVYSDADCALDAYRYISGLYNGRSYQIFQANFVDHGCQILQ